MPVVELTVDSSGAVTGLKQYDQAIDVAAKKTDTAFSKMRTSANTAGKAIGAGLAAGAASATAAIVGLGVALQDAGTKARELENLSRLAGVGAEEFQNLAYATEKYGVSGEHMADITKDVSDKLGDFIATGAGPFTDFFENVAPQVGLTAEALAELSGPDALIAVKKAMDDANVSAEEQVFYLESIGNDLTKLNPLLEDNGKLWQEAATQADALGIALSQIQIDRLKQGMEAVGQIQKSVIALKDKVLAELSPAISDFANMLKQSFLESGQTIDSLAQDIAVKLLGAVGSVIEVVRFLHNGFNGLKLAAQGIIVAFAEIARAGVSAFNFIGEAMVAVGLKDENPMAGLMQGMEDFSAAVKEGFTNQLDIIVETNQMYDTMKSKVDTITNASIQRIQAEQTTTQVVMQNKVAHDAVAASVVNETNKIKEATTATQKLTQELSRTIAEFEQLPSQVGGTSVSIGGQDARWDDEANGGGGSWVTEPTGDSSKSGVTINNNFNQKISKSDVSSITTEQARTAGRL